MKYYQKLKKQSGGDGEFSQAYIKVEDDDSYSVSCTDQCPDYLAWVAEGNTAKDVDYTE